MNMYRDAKTKRGQKTKKQRKQKKQTSVLQFCIPHKQGFGGDVCLFLKKRGGHFLFYEDLVDHLYIHLSNKTL